MYKINERVVSDAYGLGNVIGIGPDTISVKFNSGDVVWYNHDGTSLNDPGDYLIICPTWYDTFELVIPVITFVIGITLGHFL